MVSLAARSFFTLAAGKGVGKGEDERVFEKSVFHPGVVAAPAVAEAGQA
jgi:hypothetical protein